MDCERMDLLLGLVEDELDASERAAVEEHLAACEVCRETVQAYRGTREELAALPLPKPSEEARANAYAAVMAAMEQSATASAPTQCGTEPAEVDAPPRGKLIPFVRFAAAAAAVLLAVGLWQGGQGRSPNATASLRMNDAAAEKSMESAADAAAGAPAPAMAPSAPAKQSVAELEEAKGSLDEELRQAKLGRAQDEREDFAKRDASRRGEAEPRGPLPGATSPDLRELARAQAARTKEKAEAQAKSLEGFAADEADALLDAGAPAAKPRAPADAPMESDPMDDADGAAPESAPADDAGAADLEAGPQPEAGAKSEPAVRALAGRPGDAAKKGRQGGGSQPAAWTVSGPNGLRLYAMRSGRLVYRELPAPDQRRAVRERAAEFKRATPVGLVTVAPADPARLGVDGGQTRTADGRRDQRVNDELLAILASELRETSPSFGGDAPSAPAPSGGEGARRAEAEARGVGAGDDEAKDGEAESAAEANELTADRENQPDPRERQARLVALLRALGEPSSLAERPAALRDRLRVLEGTQAKLRRSLELDSEGR